MEIYPLSEPSRTIETHRIVIRKKRMFNQHRVPLLGADGGRNRYIEELNWDDRNVWFDSTGKKWVLPHSKKFIEFINKEYSRFKLKPGSFKLSCDITDEFSPPFPYQEFVREYLRYGTPYRGLILEHGLGSGKSRSAIMVAETFREQGLDILFLTPAFLKGNFIEELLKWGNEDIRLPSNYNQLSAGERSAILSQRKALIANSYHLVSYNSGGGSKTGRGGLMQKLAELGIGYPPEAMKTYNKATLDTIKQLEDEGKIPRGKGLYYPRNMLIIIEEAHDLNSKFTSTESKVMSQLYSLLLHAEDCKIICLSATPVNNDTYELTSLYNILRGPLSSDPDPITLFPDDPSTFISCFINTEAIEPKNSYFFQKRILGLHSFFRGIKDDPERLVYPEARDNDVVDCEMSLFQTQIHDKHLSEELEKEAKRKTKNQLKLTSRSGQTQKMQTGAQFAQMNEPKSNFRSSSRQASNFVFPSGVVRPRPQLDKTLIDPEMRNFRFDVSELEHLDDIHEEDREFAKLLEREMENSEPDESRIEEGDEGFKSSALSKYLIRKYPDGELASAAPTIWNLLTSGSQYYYTQLTVSDYSTRINSSISRLGQMAEEFFTDEGIQKYSCKIWKIYQTIMGDMDKGALHLEDGSMPEDEMLGHELPDIIEPESYEDDSTITPEDEKFTVPQVQAQIEDDYVNLDNYQEDSVLAQEGKHAVGGPAVIYSFFNTIEGAGVTSMFLKTRGFVEYDNPNPQIDISEIQMRPRYALITGGGRADTRQAIMRVFNHPRNRHGQLIQIVFVTQAAAQGISLFNVRQIHVMEPFWGNVKIRQVIGRGIRLCSHRNLPFDQRIVNVWRYHAVRSGTNSSDPESVAKRQQVKEFWKKNEMTFLMAMPYNNTTDKYVQGVANRKDNLIFGFKHMIDEAAVDCKSNHQQNSDASNPISCLNFPPDVSESERSYFIDFNTDFSVAAPKKTAVEIKKTVIYGKEQEPVGVLLDNVLIKKKFGAVERQVQRVYDIEDEAKIVAFRDPITKTIYKKKK